MEQTPAQTSRPHAASPISGVGLGLRWAFLDALLDGAELDEARFLEISPENYMRRGGYFPAALEEICDRYPIMTHGLMMNIGSPDGPRRDYLDELRLFLDHVGAGRHSDHLCWNGVSGQTLHDLLPIPLRDVHVQRVVDNIRRVQDHLARPMALENISYYGLIGGGTGMQERDFVAEVIERSGCTLLLDVNNVLVNAQNHGFDAYEYVRGLPLHRVDQLHVAGGERLRKFDNLIIDTHGSDVSEDVAKLMAWVVEQIGPVPVLYERDHNIPPLRELRTQLRALNDIYDRALARHQQDGETRRTEVISIKPESSALESGPLELFSAAILAPDSSQALQQPEASVQDWLRQFSDEDVQIQQVLHLGPARLKVYRDLVNNGIRKTVRDFLPRTAARRDAGFSQDLDAWLSGPGPRSKFLRDLPYEFFEYIDSKWQHNPSIPAYLSDLARHELIEFAVESCKSEVPVFRNDALALHDRLVFDPTTRILSYRFAVHELPEDRKDLREPAPEPTTLLAYRDQEHDVRYLKLTELARVLVSSLLQGETLQAAVQLAAQNEHAVRDNGRIDDDFLARVGDLLSDLSERKVILGPA